MKYILPMKLQYELISYLTYAFPYSMMNSLDMLQEWLASHYHFACAYINQDNDINIEYLDGFSYGNFHQENNMIIMSKHAPKKEDIFDYVVNCLSRHEYIVIFLDEYYRSESALYQRKHLLHEILIYGCENDCLLYTAFNNQNKFSLLRMHRKEINDSYLRGFDIKPTSTSSWIQDRRIMTFSIDYKVESTNEDVPFTKYTYGGVSNIFNETKNEYCTMYCGIDNTQLFTKVIQAQKERYHNMIPYAGMHALYESKQLIYKWLNRQNDKIAAKYHSDVLGEMNIARMIYIKEAISGKNHWRQVLSHLSIAYLREKKLLS